MSAKAAPGKKFCVFCGGPPSSKNKEHIIPRWLLRLTGNPNRRAFFGKQWLSPELKERVFSWESFTFPACEACNSRWSDLESEVKHIVDRMMKGAALSSDDFYKFLDWLDKVRVGLWFSMYYLNENYRAIIPQFHIDDRVGQQDRALLIFEGQERIKGIGMIGVNSPIFHTTPSVVYLVINQLHFISISKPFLISERIGWPFVRNMKMKDIDTDGFFGDLVPGNDQIAPVIFDTMPSPSGTVLFQPIAHPAGRNADPEGLYTTAHVIETSQPGKSGIGKLLIGNKSAEAFPNGSSIIWQPLMKYPAHELMIALTMWTAGVQRRLFLDLPDYSHFPEEDRRSRDSEIAGIVKLHDMIVEHHMKSLAKGNAAIFPA